MADKDVIPHTLTSEDWIVAHIDGQVAGGRYGGLSVDEEGLICLDFLAGEAADVPRTVHLGDMASLEIGDERRVRGLPVPTSTRRAHRAVTPEDLVVVSMRLEDGTPQPGGGSNPVLSVTSSGAVCLDYDIDVDEGFGMSDLVALITRAELYAG
jgi:hypothetical protein